MLNLPLYVKIIIALVIFAAIIVAQIKGPELLVKWMNKKSTPEEILEMMETANQNADRYHTYEQNEKPSY